MEASNVQKMREALLKLRAEIGRFYNNEWIPYDAWQECDDIISHALSAPPHKGKWKNGMMHEYAYCSECGRMEWAGWDTHKQAEEEIESFARDYKFCPGCGTEIEGGVYVK